MLFHLKSPLKFVSKRFDAERAIVAADIDTEGLQCILDVRPFQYDLHAMHVRTVARPIIGDPLRFPIFFTH